MFELPLDSPPALKTCAECAHLIGVRNCPEFAAGWQCGAPGNVKSTEISVVTGLEKQHYFHLTCADSRREELSCGPLGQWFKLYEKPPHQAPRAAGKASAEDLLSELESLK